MNKGYYITSDNIKVILETSDNIDISDLDEVTLYLPNNFLTLVHNYNNQLTDFISTDTIDLYGMGIIELVIPNGVKIVDCSHNYLTELIIPNSVEHIECHNNNLTELIVPDNCYVECDDTCNVITRTMYNRSNRLKAILK